MQTTKRGDLWRLGRHRLLCGDATCREDYDRLLGDERVALCLTDPPYGLAVCSNGKDFGPSWVEIENQATWYKAWIPEARDALTDDAPFLCFGNHRSLPAVYKAMMGAGLKVYDPVIWDKKIYGTGNVGFRNRVEFVFCGFKGKAKIEDRGACNIYERTWQTHHGTTGHPAEKPLELVTWLAEKASVAGDIVLDPFGGSGTTLIACEETARDCRMMELSEAYCDIIVGRWERLTGGVAERC